MTGSHAVAALREDRAFLAVTGAETKTFLQGLLSQDVEKAAEDRAIFGALLTPQGKFLHDLFITAIDDGVALECEADRIEDLATRLKRYRLRAKIGIEPLEGWAAAVVWGDDALDLGEARGGARQIDGATAYVDPRLALLGARVVGPKAMVQAAIADLPTGDLAAYAGLRLRLGVPEGGEDIAVDRGFLLESGFDELDGIDWQKGCYVGQELTARTKYRGLVKRRLMPVRIEGAAPPVGAALEFNGKNAGEMRSAAGDRGLALVRLDAWRAAAEAGAPLAAGDARLWPEPADWARIA